MIVFLLLGHLTGNRNSAAHLQLFCSTRAEFLSFPSGFCLSVHVTQTPAAALHREDGNVTFTCSHTEAGSRVMLWYQRSPGDNALKLIGYGYGEFTSNNIEEPFKEHFSLEGDLNGKVKIGYLSIQNLKPLEHTAEYICAVREAHCLKEPQL